MAVIFKKAFVKALQKLVPAIQAEHLSVAPAGIRAQAVGRNGSLVDDFLIQKMIGSSMFVMHPLLPPPHP